MPRVSEFTDVPFTPDLRIPVVGEYSFSGSQLDDRFGGFKYNGSDEFTTVVTTVPQRISVTHVMDDTGRPGFPYVTYDWIYGGTSIFGIIPTGVAQGVLVNGKIINLFGDTIVNNDGTFWNGGVQVVGARQAAVSPPVGGGTVDAEARTAINALISRLQAHGLIG